MKDKRKLVFSLICLVIIIVSEVFLYSKVKKEDIKYKDMMKSKLSNVVSELEIREFDSKADYKKGKLEYERKKDGYEYGYIYVDYDIEGNIDDLSLVLDYSDDLYSDDIFYDAYYIFDLLELGIEKKYDIESDLDDDFNVSDEILINENEYTLSITKKDNNKIQFEIK